jgi:hypothetical protein
MLLNKRELTDSVRVMEDNKRHSRQNLLQLCTR